MGHEVVGTGWLAWLEASALAATMRQSVFLYPLVNVLHVLGVALLVGPILMLDLRLLGAARALPMRALADHLLPWAVGGFCLLVLTGFLQLSAEATTIAANRMFQIKLVLMGAGVVNAAVFHFGPWRRVPTGNTGAPLSAFGRFGAITSLGIWLSVASAGRLIAYY